MLAIECRDTAVTVPVRLTLPPCPPLTEHQVVIGLGGGRGGPITPKERRLGDPVRPFPKASHEDTFHGEVGKTDAIVIQVQACLGIRLLHPGGHLLGDARVLSERRSSCRVSSRC